MIRIYKYHLSQRVLLTALTSIKAPLQCNYSESMTDYKLNVNRNAPDSVHDDRTAFDACKRHMRARTTVRFPALQFNAVNKQFVATRKVPVADVHRSDGIFGRAAGAGTRFRVRVWITNSTAVVAEVSPLLTYGGSRLSCLKRQVSRKNK